MSLFVIAAAQAHAMADQDPAETAVQQAARSQGATATEVLAASSVPDQLIIKLRVESSESAAHPAQEGVVTNPADSATSDLEDLMSRYRVGSRRRIFRQLERADGTLSTTAQEQSETVRNRFRSRATRVRPDVPVPDLENIFVLELGEGSSLEAAIRDFAAHPDVVYAEPNYIYRTFAEPLPAEPFVPNDRFLTTDGVHWSEGAWGQPFPDLYGLRNVRAIEAWNVFDTNQDGSFGAGEILPGEGVLVAVIDTGVDVAHPDISANIWKNPGEILNGIDDDGNGFIDDTTGWNFVDGHRDPADGAGHGTHVAGTIAATSNNSIGIVGVAPGASILPVRSLDDGGRGTAEALANGLIYATDTGADIVSNSWGGIFSSKLIADAFSYAYAVGVLAVASAGNSNTDVAIAVPASYDTVIAVAALDPNDVRASFSNHGLGIDVAAPGTDVLSLNSNSGSNFIATTYPDRVVEGHYLWLNGTSMACPHVSGVAALLMSHFPTESIDEIRARLVFGAVDVGAVNPGYENRLGFGRVDALGSLQASAAPIVTIIGVSAPDLQPGHSTNVTVELLNRWLDVEGVVATLTTNHPDVGIELGRVDYGAIPSGQSVPGLFRIDLETGTPRGTPITFEVALTGTGFADRLAFDLSVEEFQDVSVDVNLPAFDVLPVHLTPGDYDGDGLSDLHVMGFQNGQLFRNRGDLSFEVTTQSAGIGVPGGLGFGNSIFLDYDGDSDLDLWVGGNPFVGQPLYQNQGDGTFVEVDTSGWLAPNYDGWNGTSLDWDGDGRLDVFSANKTTYLIRNNGDGTFTDVRDISGLPTKHQLVPGQAKAADFDGDGDTDLVTIQMGSNTAFFRNDDGVFTDATVEAGLAHPSEGGRSVAVGDYDGDLDLDLFFTGLRGDIRNALHRNNGDGTFTNALHLAGELATSEASGATRGTEFFDYDNDGDLDLYISSDGTGSMPYDNLWRNNGDGTFTRVNIRAFGKEVFASSTVTAFTDYDLDGDIDIYAPGNAFGLFAAGGFFRNMVGNENHWIGLRLVTATGDPEAIGARVILTADGRSQLRELHDSGVAPSPIHFGLGQAEEIEKVEIRWPDGTVQLVDGIRRNRFVTVNQGEDPCAGGVDTDEDGWPDSCDSCPLLVNPAQQPFCDVIPVAVDIKPRKSPNFIAPTRRGNISVALLGSETFDVSQVDESTLSLGPDGAVPRRAPGGKLKDVNKDGFVDLVSKYIKRETGIERGDTEACVSGELIDGRAFMGCDEIVTSP